MNAKFKSYSIRGDVSCCPAGDHRAGHLLSPYVCRMSGAVGKREERGLLNGTANFF
jgi:hypothetical protein